MATSNNAQQSQPGPIARQLTKIQANGQQVATPQLNGQKPPTKKSKWGLSDKTFWDWLPLLIQLLGALAIPIGIAVGTTWFSYQQNLTSVQIADDQQKEAELQGYLDHMSDLLLNNHLRESKLGDEVRQVARSRTLTVLQTLDPNRKASLLRFLYETDLIKTDSKIIDLNTANLHDINMNYVDLNNIDLSGAYLQNASMSGASLSHAKLNMTSLYQANLTDASLDGANLEALLADDATFNNANLSGADLKSALFSNSHLIGANLSNTNLNNARFDGADLFFVDLSGANLSKINIQGANLSGAILIGITGITPQELEKQAKSLKGAIMPDGSKHP